VWSGAFLSEGSHNKAGSRREKRRNAMHRMVLAAAAVAAGLAGMAAPALAQGEQFLPSLVYRTGPYAPNGIPFADGVADYWTLINERDGGINGVKLVFEECETGYATDKGVECYERLKGKGTTGAGYFSPLSTGITFALTERVPGDRIPLLTTGYGRSESRDGSVFMWNFIALGIPVSVETVSLSVFIVKGMLICYLLIVEPHGFARLWSIGKEKLRLWPYPY
jgi:branched-chain amino acid transport system substrate-binding protein